MRLVFSACITHVPARSVVPSAPAVLGVVLVRLDGLLEFSNFLLQQHFEKLGHLRTHHIAHGVEYLGHELRQRRGKLRLESSRGASGAGDARVFDPAPWRATVSLSALAMVPCLAGTASGGTPSFPLYQSLVGERPPRQYAGEHRLAPRVAQNLSRQVRLAGVRRTATASARSVESLVAPCAALSSCS